MVHIIEWKTNLWSITTNGVNMQVNRKQTMKVKRNLNK